MNLLFITLPLYIASRTEKGIEGKTRLQKLVFLVQESLKKKGIELGFNFEPASYGPYSPALAETVDMLCEKGFINEKTIGTTKVLHIFTLQNSGKAVLDEFQAQIPQNVKESVEEVLGKFGKTSLKELLDFVHEQYPEYVKKQ